MRALVAASLILCASCSAPALTTRGAVKAQISTGSMAFNVFHTQERADAHRPNFAVRSKGKQVLAAARIAVMQSRGCDTDLSGWSGDVAVVKVDVLC